MQPRLTRSTTESMVAGVCGGLAEYFSIDPVIVRLIFVLVTLTSGLGLPVYLVLWILMPKASAEHSATGETVNLSLPQDVPPGAYVPPPAPRGRSWRTLGLILIGIGALILLEQFGIDMSLIFPALLIAAGVILLRRKR